MIEDYQLPLRQASNLFHGEDKVFEQADVDSMIADILDATDSLKDFVLQKQNCTLDTSRSTLPEIPETDQLHSHEVMTPI